MFCLYNLPKVHLFMELSPSMPKELMFLRGSDCPKLGVYEPYFRSVYSLVAREYEKGDLYSDLVANSVNLNSVGWVVWGLEGD